MAFFASISRKSFPFLSSFTKSFSIYSSPPPHVPEDPLVSAAVSILKHHRSKSRWSHLRSLLTVNKTQHLTPSQFSQAALHLRNNPHLALRFFNFTVRHSLCSHSLFSYATVIHILSRARLKSEALSLIKSAMCVFAETSNQQRNGGPLEILQSCNHQRNVDPLAILETSNHQRNGGPLAILEALIRTYRTCDSAPFVFDLLVRACLESKKIDLAIEIYRMLKSKKVFLRISTCNSLIELVSKSKGCFAGYDLYREMFNFDFDNVDEIRKRVMGVSPNANTFNVIMVCFHREGMVDKVEEMWREMARIGCSPNIYSFNVLMAAHCDDGRMEDTVKMWKEMENKGLKHDVVSYNTIIGGFCRTGEVKKAEEMYEEMVTNGVESTCVTFEHLISGYCCIGDFDSLMLLYNDMCRKGFDPGSLTINMIVGTLCDKNEVSSALEFWRIAESKHEVLLEKKNYVSLIRGLCEEGKMEEASKLQAKMAVKGFEPSSEIYAAFMDGYAKQGNETMVGKLKKEMFQANFST